MRQNGVHTNGFHKNGTGSNGLAVVMGGISPRFEQCLQPHAVAGKDQMRRYRPDGNFRLDGAIAEHEQVRGAIEEAGAQVLLLDGEPELPDSCFVRDPVLPTFDRRTGERVIVLLRLAEQARRAETDWLHRRVFREMGWRVIELPEGATVEGGDIRPMCAFTYAVNATGMRTNRVGFEAISKILTELGHRVQRVEVAPGYLHTDTVLGSLGYGDDGREVLIVNPDGVQNLGELRDGREIIEVDTRDVVEPLCPNSTRIGDVIITYHAPRIIAELQKRFRTARVRPVALEHISCGDGGPNCLTIPADPLSYLQQSGFVRGS